MEMDDSTGLPKLPDGYIFEVMEYYTTYSLSVEQCRNYRVKVVLEICDTTRTRIPYCSMMVSEEYKTIFGRIRTRRVLQPQYKTRKVLIRRENIVQIEGLQQISDQIVLDAAIALREDLDAELYRRSLLGLYPPNSLKD